MKQSLKDKIASFKESFTTALEQVKTHDELEALRISYLGRNGTLTELMGLLKTASIDEKKEYGPALNMLKKETELLFNEKKESLEKKDLLHTQTREQNFDVTAYRTKRPYGSLHIYTHLLEKIGAIFTSMGFAHAQGPEVETDYYNFEALNIPENHPARDLHDTFWLSNPELLLRTHTSTVQIRTMEKAKPPLAIFAPGRCYRNEATDATHEFMFMQGEVLLIDKDISIAHLLATARAFLQQFFEKETLDIRVRPSYFPFVEPGLEIDASCPFCSTGCSVCKKTGWIELLGSGLVHPNVLKSCSINPEEYTGFAFGFGLERLAMIKYGITDIRLFHSSKLSFLDQF